MAAPASNGDTLLLGRLPGHDMSVAEHLKRRYRRLPAVYPAPFRREHEEAFLSVLMDGAAEGRRWAAVAESVNLLMHAMSMRLHQRVTGVSP